jgi:uncharacterized membrane protein
MQNRKWTQLLIPLSLVGFLPTVVVAQGQNSKLLHYTVTDLGLLGPAGAPLIIRNSSLIVGTALVPGGADHAVYWHNRMGPVDLGTPGLGGPNSVGNGVNDRAEFVGAAQTATPDSEDFCGFQAAGLTLVRTTCLPFLWRDGVMTPLPPLAGRNGVASAINNRRDVAGIAETNMPDPLPGCPVHQFKPVLWQNGQTQPLPLKLLTSANDLNGEPFGINEKGQVVGASGDCTAFNPVLNYFQPLHALLWEKDGAMVTDLGNLGGTGQAALGNWAISINNEGQGNIAARV